MLNNFERICFRPEADSSQLIRISYDESIRGYAFRKFPLYTKQHA